ncbi:MAG TPA: sigma-70 family RNA polymerase sigma factor [Fimbriiglobus sp.]|jgi:RNA polymerase sigma factor (sigma-70 family)
MGNPGARMARSPRSLFARLIRRLPPPDGDFVPDAELVARFAADRDPAAFELLVWRHGALVLGVCRRILRDEHLAEDAFQATFFVLARKAGPVRGRNLAGWLHRVARRVAVRAAKKRAKVSVREKTLAAEPVCAASQPYGDWKSILDAEVGRLPDRFRLPVLLCYLQDYTTDEAARILGIPRGTVLSRLSTARQRLSARLTKRGVALPATLAASSVASNQLISATVRSAAVFAVGEAAVPSASTLLATEVIRMSAWKLPAGIAAAMMLTVGVGSGVAWVQGGGQGQGNVARQTSRVEPKQSKPQPDNRKQEEAARQQFRIKLEQKREEIEKSVASLNQRILEKVNQMRDLSLEEFPVIQQRYSDLGRQLATANQDLKGLRFDIKIFENRVKELNDAMKKEMTSRKPVRIDTSTRYGMRLQAFNKRMIEVELNIDQATHGGKQPTDAVVMGLKKQLNILSNEIISQEDDIRTSLAQENYNRDLRELEKKQKYDMAKATFLQEHIVLLENNMKQDIKLGIQIGKLESEVAILKSQLVDWNQKLADVEQSITLVDLPVGSDANRTDRIDMVLLELSKLRKEVTDLKQALRK